MNPHLRYFLAGLLGVVLYKALNFALGPDEFDFAKEAVEVVILAKSNSVCTSRGSPGA